MQSRRTTRSAPATDPDLAHVLSTIPPATRRQVRALVNAGELQRAFEIQLDALGAEKPIPEFRFCPTRRFRADFAWPHLMLLVELEGGIYLGKKGRHTNPAGYQRDAEKYNLAQDLGYRVMRYTSKEIRSWRAAWEVFRKVGGRNGEGTCRPAGADCRRDPAPAGRAEA